MNESPGIATTSLLEFSKVRFSFGEAEFIRNIGFTIRPGELVGLMGPNGAGKSTLLKLAAGILSPQNGKVLIEGREVRSYSGKERAQRLAYLPQILDMHAPFRVGELVRMGEYSYLQKQHFTIDEALEMVGLTDKSNVFLGDLSGGERRRAYVAMTLVQGGRLLLLDEPLANLDLKFQIELIRLLRRICHTNGISVLLSLHDIALGHQLDRVIMVKNGNLIAEGVPAEVLSNETIQVAYDLELTDIPTLNAHWAIKTP
ncbi:hypothetical protein RW64_01475 [Geobacter sulfurreducens]|nr:hypothetical protein RW64_01475 [Geobacter sulfurreducens]